MKNAKIASIAAAASFALSLALGFAGRVRLPALLVRPFLFAALFFAFAIAVTGFLLPKAGIVAAPEPAEPPQTPTDESEGEPQVGTKLDISVGDEEEEKERDVNTVGGSSDLSGKSDPPPQEQKSKSEASSWKPASFPTISKGASLDKNNPLDKTNLNSVRSREGLDTNSREVYNNKEPVPVYSAAVSTATAETRAAEVVKSVGPDQVALAIKSVLKRDEV